MEKVPTLETVRVEVIAKYPGMRLELGQIIEVYKDTGKLYATDEDKVDYRDYPALFKELED